MKPSADTPTKSQDMYSSRTIKRTQVPLTVWQASQHIIRKTTGMNRILSVDPQCLRLFRALIAPVIHTVTLDWILGIRGGNGPVGVRIFTGRFDTSQEYSWLSLTNTRICCSTESDSHLSRHDILVVLYDCSNPEQGYSFNLIPNPSNIFSELLIDYSQKKPNS